MILLLVVLLLAKYVRSTEVDPIYATVPVTLGMRERTTFWLSMSFNWDLDSVPVRSSWRVPLASEAVICRPVPTVTADGFHNVSIVMLLDPEAARGATTLIC